MSTTTNIGFDIPDIIVEHGDYEVVPLTFGRARILNRNAGQAW